MGLARAPEDSTQRGAWLLSRAGQRPGLWIRLYSDHMLVPAGKLRLREGGRIRGG